MPYSDETVWFVERERHRVRGGVQPSADAASVDSLVTGLAVAFAFRCGMFNIGGQGQYIVGAMVAVWVGLWVDMQPGLHVILAIGLAALAGALGRDRRLPAATVGAHEVITTIMLNWTAYWIGNFAFGQGGPLQNKVNESVPVSSDVAPGPGCRSSGATRSSRASTSASSWRWRRSSSTGSPSRGRRSATRCGRSASTPRRRATAASASPRATSSRWRSRAFAGDGRRTRHPRLAVPARRSTSRARRSASSGSPSRCSAATRRSA